eukprot:6450244-Pyramimonas_sp.AAC.2
MPPTELALPDVQITCDNGAKGGLYDYAMVKEGFSQLVSLKAVTDVPLATHCGVEVRLKGVPQKWWHRSLSLVASLPRYDKPKVEASSSSRRTLIGRYRKFVAMQLDWEQQVTILRRIGSLSDTILAGLSEDYFGKFATSERS